MKFFVSAALGLAVGCSFMSPTQASRHAIFCPTMMSTAPGCSGLTIRAFLCCPSLLYACTPGDNRGDKGNCARDSKGKCKPINITCEPLKKNMIDWDCIFGPDSLEEVHARGGRMIHCTGATRSEPCARFIVAKDKERAEVKVQQGPDGFPFAYGEHYIFKYSFRPKADMKVTKRFTHLGQIKASKGGYMIKGDPIVSLTANSDGLMVRFSNKESIPDFYPGMEKHLDWEDCTGEWVHVEIDTVFGKSMEVTISGAVKGKAVWPSKMKPVAWNNDGTMARMKLGVYHSTHNVAHGEAEYKDISIEGPNGIIRTSSTVAKSASRAIDVCEIDEITGLCMKEEIICDPLEGNMIDWDCVFGPDSLEEVFERGGIMTTCPSATPTEPCARFIVAKEEERSEVKVQEGSEGFTFLKGDPYIFRYSFRAVKDMMVSNRFTHLGQLKGSAGGYMLNGDPIYSLTANNDGLMVRFSNKESIEDFYPGMEQHLDWEDATGEWVHVEIETVFGESMEVRLSGAVEGTAVWPQDLEPIAWHNQAEMVRMKLGLYHSVDNVADGEVEYKNIEIEGPGGIIRTSSPGGGAMYVACIADEKRDRVLSSQYVDEQMTLEMCQERCAGDHYFGTQYGVECWCGDERSDIYRHGFAVCDYPCGGDSEQTCGGIFAMSLYENNGAPENVIDEIQYLGCYGDASDRVFSGRRTVSDSMSQEMATPEIPPWILLTNNLCCAYMPDSVEQRSKACYNFCVKNRASYFGLQYGEECHCGSDTDYYNKEGLALCDMKCTGDSDSICGGKWALSVYLIH